MAAMLFPMELTGRMLAIVIVGVFLASFVDGVAGGGGIISVPTYFLAGLPAHLALGTNKLSSGIGTAVSTARFIRGGYVDWKLAVPSIALALYGAHLGTKLQLALERRCKGQVRAEYVVDKELLGGLVVEVDGNILDGSLRQRLSEVKEVIRV